MNHGRRNNNNEKPKDFKRSISNLIKYCKPYFTPIIIAIVLAVISSILSIIGPDKLRDITNLITNGLGVNQNNIEVLNNKIQDNFSTLNISNILSSNELTSEEKSNIINSLSSIDANNKLLVIDSLSKLPSNVLNILFKDIEVNNNKINGNDQVKYLSIISKLDSKDNNQEMLSKLGTMPKSIQASIQNTMPMDDIMSIVLLLGGIYVISAIFGYIEQLIMAIVTNKFSKHLRKEITEKINVMPLKYFDRNSYGDVLSRVTNDVDTLSMTLNQSFANLVSSITLLIGSVLMMFITNSLMAVTAIVSSIVGFIFMFLVISRSQKYFDGLQENIGTMDGHIEEMYSGHNVMRVYNGTKDANCKFDEINDEIFDNVRKGQFLSGLMHPFMGFIGNFGYVCVCIVGALLTMNNVIDFGVIVAFMLYIRLFTQPLSQIAQSFSSLQSCAAASERVFEFLDEEEMEDESAKTKVLDKAQVKGNIEFKHVKFGYNDDKIIIKDFSVSVKSGEKIAIVGPTGAGKTTMVNLLMKFYNVTSGDILIDGINTKDLTRENIHDLFIMVLQDPWLFEGTVADNIRYNKENVSLDDIKEVCKVVGLHHFIKTLPQGYDTILTDNEALSSGQKQLLTIARGMIKDAPFLILDEATSSVDTRTEELVQKAMDKITEGRTSFIIAHRLSTIKNADLILMMQDGNIVETGTHEELLKLNGKYAELYNSQFEKLQ